MDLARSSLALSFAKGSGTVISFLGILYFARELGAAVLGIFFLFEALSGIISILSNLGTRKAVEKRISEGRVPEEMLTTGIIMKLSLLSILIIPIFLLSDYINQYIGAQVIFPLIIAVIAKEFGHLMANVLKAELRVSEAALLKLLNKIVWISTAAILVGFGYGVYGLIYGVIAGFTSKFIVGWYLKSTSFGTPALEHAYSIWDYSKYTIIPSIDSYVHSWTDVLIIGFFLTSAAVGAYEIAWRILAPIFVVSAAVSATIFPQISSWDAQEQTERIEAVFPKALTPALILVIPAFFGSILLSSEILNILFGEDFGAAALALPILIAGLLPRAIRSITGRTLGGINQPRFVNRAAIVDLVANILLNIILVWQLGIVGAAIGTTLSYTLGASLRWYYLEQYLTLQVPYRELSWCIGSSIGMFVILYIIKQTIAVESISALFSLVILGVILYSGLILVYQPLRSTIFNHLNRFTGTSL